MGRAKEDGRGDAAPSVNGFTALRVRVPRLPFVQVLYVKAHRSKKHDEAALPSDRTVFVANAGLGESALRGALASFGEIERVEMSGGGRQLAQHSYVQAPAHDAPAAPAGAHGPQHAHVVFSKKRSCAAALQCDAVIEPAGDAADGDDEEGAHRAGPAQGVRSWVQQFRSREVAEDELQASVDAYMTYFDERTEAEKQAWQGESRLGLRLPRVCNW